MRRLILLRHAKTERDAPSGRDIDRRLDERGRHDAVEMGHWLMRSGFVPDHVLVSTATRAEETWDLLAPLLPVGRVDHVADLYGADPSDLLKAVREMAVEDPRQLLIIAHNPGLHELALGLIGHGDAKARRALAINLPTAAAVVIDFDVDDWSEVRFRAGHLASFISPKLLRERSGTITD